MKCFYHHERDAVGICKSCGKGLCQECSIDLGKGLACRDHCENDAKAVIELIERNIKLTSRAESNLAAGHRIRNGTAVFNLVIGVVFLGWGIADSNRLPLLIVLGFFFIVYAIFLFSQAKKKTISN